MFKALIYKTAVFVITIQGKLENSLSSEYMEAVRPFLKVVHACEGCGLTVL